ncbi:MAG: hypothetical protein AAF244_05270 [Pseudomonadota bacterium]
MNRFRVMPLLVLVAALSFGVRFGEFVTGVRDHPGHAHAQELSNSSSDNNDLQVAQLDVTDQSAVNTNLIEAAVGSEDEPRTAPVPDMSKAEPIYDWRDAGDSDFESSSVRMELFEELKDRRKTLDERARELSVREALLKAAEKEIEQKYEELLSLRSEIQELLVEQDEEEKARIASLRLTTGMTILQKGLSASDSGKAGIAGN